MQATLLPVQALRLWLVRCFLSMSNGVVRATAHNSFSTGAE